MNAMIFPRTSAPQGQALAPSLALGDRRFRPCGLAAVEGSDLVREVRDGGNLRVSSGPLLRPLPLEPRLGPAAGVALVVVLPRGVGEPDPREGRRR